MSVNMVDTDIAWHSHAVEYYTARKRNEPLLPAESKHNRDLILSMRSKTPRARAVCFHFNKNPQQTMAAGVMIVIPGEGFEPQRAHGDRQGTGNVLCLDLGSDYMVFMCV